MHKNANCSFSQNLQKNILFHLSWTNSRTTFLFFQLLEFVAELFETLHFMPSLHLHGSTFFLLAGIAHLITYSINQSISLEFPSFHQDLFCTCSCSLVCEISANVTVKHPTNMFMAGDVCIGIN